MRISDWSSDVCSSDLLADEPFRGAVGVAVRGVDEVAAAIDIRVEDAARLSFIGAPAPIGAKRHCDERHRRNGSEERSVGKECVRTCRSRWSPSHYKKKKYLIQNKCKYTKRYN